MTSETEQDVAAQYIEITRRWFTAGWTGDVDMADGIFSGNLRTNGVHVGIAGPKGRITERLTAFPDLTTSIEDIFTAGDKLVIRLVWRGTHTGSYGGVAATGKPVEVRDTAIWRFQDGKVVQIETMQDQFAFLKQVGYLPAGVYAA
jgi:predicted ester cyclase